MRAGPGAERQRGARSLSVGSGGDSGAWSALRSIRSRRGSALCARGRAGRSRPPAWVSRSGGGAGAAGGGRRRALTPSLAFFFLASVPPSLPRNDSSFFILWGRRAGERSGAEDMGTHGDPGGRAGSSASGAALVASAAAARSPRGWPGGRGPGAGPAPARPWPRRRPPPGSGSGSPRPACESRRRFPTRRVTLTLQAQRWFPSKCRQSDGPRALCAPFVLLV